MDNNALESEPSSTSIEMMCYDESGTFREE